MWRAACDERRGACGAPPDRTMEAEPPREPLLVRLAIDSGRSVAAVPGRTGSADAAPRKKSGPMPP
eukprot:352490-Prymnesium_polylepis.1